MYKHAMTRRGMNAYGARVFEVRPRLVIKWTSYGKMYQDPKTKQWFPYPTGKTKRRSKQKPFLIKRGDVE